MEPAKWTDIMQALATLGVLLVTLAGFLFVIRQVRQIERTIRKDTNTSLCAQSIEILKEMAKCPQCYPCCYENAPLPEDEKVRVEVLCICEMIANYLDNVALQHDNLPQPVWERWRSFIRDTLAGSQVIQEHFRKFRNWYSPELIAYIDEVHPSKSQSSGTKRGGH
jgi:hypothetical protein